MLGCFCPVGRLFLHSLTLAFGIFTCCNTATLKRPVLFFPPTGGLSEKGSVTLLSVHDVGSQRQLGALQHVVPGVNEMLVLEEQYTTVLGVDVYATFHIIGMEGSGATFQRFGIRF